MVPPGETVQLTSQIPLDNTLGRFKANVSLNYGESQKASLFDTTYFYLMPARILFILFGGVLFVALFSVLLLRRAFARQEVEDDYHDVLVYVRDGHEPRPMDHDIDLKNKNDS